MIKSVFSQNGELMGFQLRPELAPMLYANSGYDLTQLKKVIKTVMYMNRLIRDGKEDDFLVKQIKDGVVVDDGEKKL